MAETPADPPPSAWQAAPTSRAPVYAPAPPTSSKADAALVLGIISILVNVLYVPGILAILWGGRERQENSKARAGFVCGIIGTVLSALVTVLFIVAIVSAGNAVKHLPSSPTGGRGLGSAACTQALAEQQRALGNASTHMGDPAATQRLADANAAQLEAC